MSTNETKDEEYKHQRKGLVLVLQATSKECQQLGRSDCFDLETWVYLLNELLAKQISKMQKYIRIKETKKEERIGKKAREIIEFSKTIKEALKKSNILVPKRYL
jgi:hypothetical protein